jgi:hypothetical protein
MRRILTGLVLLASLVGPAAAADYGQTYQGWDGPSCESSSVTWRISEKYAYQDRHLIHSGLRITAIDGFHLDGVGDPWHGGITRVYCGATAWLSNGGRAEVVYVIEGPRLGTFSHGWHVESCVAGYDPFHVYDAQCRSIRY